MEKSQQGVLLIGANTLYTCPVGKVVKLNVRFNCSIAYTLKISKVSVSLIYEITMYDLTLDPGDTINDVSWYFLEPGDSIKATTNVGTVNYYINYIEI